MTQMEELVRTIEVMSLDESHKILEDSCVYITADIKYYFYIEHAKDDDLNYIKKYVKLLERLGIFCQTVLLTDNPYKSVIIPNCCLIRAPLKNWTDLALKKRDVIYVKFNNTNITYRDLTLLIDQTQDELFTDSVHIIKK